MAGENIGSIFSVVSVNLQSLSKPIANLKQGIRDLGKEFATTGVPLRAFGDQLATTLGIALRWYLAYRVIRTVIGGVGKAFEDIKRLQVQEIFTPIVFAGEKLSDVFIKITPLATKWGRDVVETYEATTRFGRALSVDLPTALSLTEVALKSSRVSGQSLNETVSSMIGMITNLDLSLSEVSDTMKILYTAAFRTDEVLGLMIGKTLVGSQNAMQALTDAIDAGGIGLKNLGLNVGQIAAIFSVLITRLDQSGSRIGQLSSKMFLAMKENQKLRELFKSVNVELHFGEGLLDELVLGYERLSQVTPKAAGELAKAIGVVGVGVEQVETFVKALPRIREVFDEITKSKFFDETLWRMMETIQAKEDRLKASTQALGLAFKDVLGPAITGALNSLLFFMPTLEKTAFFMRYIMVGAANDLAIAMELSAPGRTIKEKWAAIQELMKENQQLWDDYVTVALRGGVDYEKTLKEMTEAQNKFTAAMKGISVEDVLILERAKDVMADFGREINIATYRLGPYASDLEKSRAKVELLEQQLEELNRSLAKTTGIAAKEELIEAIEKTRLEIAEINKERREYIRSLIEGHKYELMSIRGLRESTILSEKIRDIEKEITIQKERGLAIGTLQEEKNRLILERSRQIEKEIMQIYNQLENITTTGLMGVIEGTKTWQNILEDIGRYTIQEIIKGLIQASLIGEALRGVGSNIWNILGAITGLGRFLGGGVKTPTTTTGVVTGLPTAHRGGEIPILRYQFGGEVPILARRGEYIVSEGPAQKYKGLLEYINRGGELGGKTDEITIINLFDQNVIPAIMAKETGRRVIVNTISDDLIHGRTTRRVIRSDRGD